MWMTISTLPRIPESCNLATSRTCNLMAGWGLEDVT